MNQRETTWWSDVHQSRIPLDGGSRPVDDDTVPVRSEAELEALKSQWDGDPSWDLYCAKGFERHRGELFAHQFASESATGQTRDARVAASAASLNIGIIPAGAIESEARSLRRLIFEARDEIVRSISTSREVSESVVTSIESQVEHAVVTARLLERPEDDHPSTRRIRSYLEA